MVPLKTIAMNNLLVVSGIVLWSTILIFFILRLALGRSWLKKSLASIFIGPGLAHSLVQLVREFNRREITDETVGNVAASLIRRFSRIGLIALTVALIPMILLFQQNQLLSLQNERMDLQNNLLESDRRSSLVFLLSNVLDKVDEEIRSQQTKTAASEIGAEIRYRLSPSLISRIVALSKAFMPYRVMEENQLKSDLISPERGQLFTSIIGSQLDSFTTKRIAQDADFSYAQLRGVNIYGQNLKGVNLSYADLSGSSITNSTMYRGNLKKTKLDSTTVNNSDLQGVNLSHSSFSWCEIRDSKFNYSDLSKTFFFPKSLSGNTFNSTNFSNSRFHVPVFGPLTSSYRNVDFSGAKLLGIDQLVRDSANFKSHLPMFDSLLEGKSFTDVEGIDPDLMTYIKQSRPCLFDSTGCELH